jgi:hypothetical protein
MRDTTNRTPRDITDFISPDGETLRLKDYINWLDVAPSHRTPQDISQEGASIFGQLSTTRRLSFH